MNLPSDYEECGDCGFDHGYDPEEAFHAHKNLAIKAEHLITVPCEVSIDYFMSKSTPMNID